MTERKNMWVRWIKDLVRTPEQDAPTALPEEAIPPQAVALQQAIALRARTLPKFWLQAGLLAVTVVGLNAYPLVFAIPLYILLIRMALASTALFESDATIRAALRELATTEDLQAVGPLAEALPLWEHSYSQVSTTLCRLLPNLQASDNDLLNERQRTCLHRALRVSANRLVFWRDDPYFAGVLRNALSTLEGLPPLEATQDEEVQSVSQDQAVERLLEPFQAAVRQRRKNTVTMTVAAAISAVSALANLLLQMFPYPHDILFFGAVGALIVTFSLSFRGLWRLQGFMNALATSSDLRITGPLLETALVEDGSAKAMALQLLSSLLPRFRASDANLLSEAQYAALLRTLTRNADSAPAYFIAALRALEQIGDLKALPIVEKLAKSHYVFSIPRRVQAAAQDCLPYLQVRCEQQRASQTLLRASGPSEMPFDTLLRPAHEAGTTEAAELLRAGTSSPDPQ